MPPAPPASGPDPSPGPGLDPGPRLSRRRLLQLGLALPLPMVLAACDDGPAGDPATGFLVAAANPRGRQAYAVGR